MQSSLLAQGVELMLFGMGTVFIFLACLVMVTTFMSALLQRFMPEVTPESQSTLAPAAQDDKLIAVIIAAVHNFRSRNKP